MSKLESIIVGFVVGIACLWLTFVAFWWTAALLYLRSEERFSRNAETDIV